MPGRKRASRQDRGYDDAWYALRAKHLATNPMCVRCGDPAEQVDHKTPFNGVDDPLRLDEGNLQALCIVCHAKKTAEDQRDKPEKQKPGPKSRYTADEKVENNRKANREQSRKRSREGQEIGELPTIKNPARRAACRQDLALALKTYFPDIFKDPFSQAHLDIIAKAQIIVEKGGKQSIAMSRGWGKTVMCECISILSVLYGLQVYVIIIGAASDAAKDIMKSIRDEIESNELLLDDFPEAIYPLRCLEGEPRRCQGQTYKGERTRTEWGPMQIKFPTMPNSPSSGAMIRAAGITGQLRGKKGKVKNDDGTTVIFRPSLCLIDDGQSEQSALSDTQCRNRERIINQSILGLAGKKVNMAALMTCTVFRRNDLADRFLDSKLHPEWNGSRFKFIYEWPTNTALWDEYKEIRLSFNPSIPGELEQAETRATEFYIDNQPAMDTGARVAWEHAYRSNEVSAIQSAMNRHIDDPRGFAAECQQEPMPEENTGVAPMTAKEIAAKLNGLERCHVPLTATRLTAAIDVQGDMLFYCVIAWEDRYTGYIIDYGSFPEQGRVYYTKADATRSIAKATCVAGFEGQIYKALEMLCEKVLGRAYPRGDGGTIRVEKCLIDANYGDSTNVVYQFCLQSQYAAILLPIHGKGIGVTGRPMSQWPKNPGERHDPNGTWIITQNTKRREIKYGILDVNSIKSFVYNRLAVAMGSPGCISLWGRDATLHGMFGDHLTAEYPVEGAKDGRTISVWYPMPGRDNDFFDTVVYNVAAASMQGVALKEGAAPERKPTGERKSWSKMQQEAAGRKR